MTQGIEITFRNTEDEYVSATQTYLAHALHTKSDIVAGSVFLVAAALYWLFIGPSLLVILVVCVSLLLLLMVVLVTVVSPRIRFHQEPKYRDEYHLHFMDDGIAFRTEHVESKIKWELYQRMLENDGLYVLIYGRQMFSVIPKRAFMSEEQEASFRDLLRRKIHALS